MEGHPHTMEWNKSVSSLLSKVPICLNFNLLWPVVRALTVLIALCTVVVTDQTILCCVCVRVNMCA